MIELVTASKPQRRRAKPGERAALRRPLTDSQQKMALSLEPRIYHWIRNVIHTSVISYYGLESLKQECRLAICLASADYRPDENPDVVFVAFAYGYVRYALIAVLKAHYERLSIWYQPPLLNTEDNREIDMADYRREASNNPALRVWCSDDYAIKRQKLSWRQRIAIYLLAVEQVPLRDLGRIFDVTTEAVRIDLIKAIAKTAEHSHIRSIHKLLTGRIDEHRSVQ